MEKGMTRKRFIKVTQVPSVIIMYLNQFSFEANVLVKNAKRYEYFNLCITTD